VATGVFLSLHLATLLDVVRFPTGAGINMTLFVIHGLILVITFHKIPVPPFWAPLIRVTTFRMKVARGCLVLTVANFIVDLPLLVTSSSAERGLEQLLVLFITALLLISAVYIVKHTLL
jgi:hypothetical protein